MIFASGLSLPEGPALLPDGNWLLVEMGADRGSVTYLSADGREKHMVARTGRPNGLALDRWGNMWVTETLNPSLRRVTADGEVFVTLTACDHEHFLFPNDLCFGPDGALYMTDSGIYVGDLMPGGQIRPDYERLMPDGRVYRIDIRTRQARKLDSGLRFANGIAFGPDDDLYVSETMSGMIYRYPWLGDGRVGRREDLANVLDPHAPAGFKGPDGLKFAQDGRLYVAVFGQGEVVVLGRNGQVLERIKTAGLKPTNLAFGPSGQRRIYVTEDELGNLETFDVGVDGRPLYT